MTKRFTAPPSLFSVASGFMLSVALLAGCSTLPQPPREQARFDLGLPQVPTATTAARALPPLALADVQVSALSENSTLMMYRLAYANALELRPYQQARWSQPPAQLIQQRMRLLLGTQRPLLSSMDNISTAAGQPSAALLKVDVEDFSQIFESASGSVGSVQLRATLLGPAGPRGGNALLGQRVFTVRQAAKTADAAGGAQALAQATDAALAQVDAWLLGLGR